MKKLVLFAAVAVLALASCGNKCENAADSTAIDSIVTDSIVADSIVADSIVADSAAVVAE